MASCIYNSHWQTCSSQQMWVISVMLTHAINLWNWCKDKGTYSKWLAIMENIFCLLYFVTSFWCADKLENNDVYGMVTNSHWNPLTTNQGRSWGNMLMCTITCAYIIMIINMDSSLSSALLPSFSSVFSSVPIFSFLVCLAPFLVWGITVAFRFLTTSHNNANYLL